jgi:group II intron reverse transcriptase/maturase
MSIKLAWKDVDWKLVHKRLSRQQRRVYKASLERNTAKVHAIQRRIIGSLDARLMAVRRVTTENKGRNTAGVDGQKAISHEMKMKLVSKLKLDGKAKAIRRVYIPKPGKSDVRPLGIPTIEDRAKQMLAKLALEPEWEAVFEPNSYGFRPGRSCHDAIASLFLSLRGKSRFVLDADIQKCFDRIDHKKLLTKLATFDQMESQIEAWLKADIMVGYLNRPDEIFQSMEGTPQRGIISPLLANIALHGLETHIKEWYATTWYPFTGLSRKIPIRDRKASIGFSRYADDFVITAPKLSDLSQIEKQVEIWLSEEVGLSLSKAKTRIVHSTEGFEFLGFQLISVKKSDQYRLKIHPSKESKKRLASKVRDIIQHNRSASSYNLIQLLAPRIMGWGNYFQYSECQIDFSKMDRVVFSQLRAWVFRRKSKGLRSRTKIKEKYFPSGKTYVFRGKEYSDNWVLAGQTLIQGQKKDNFLPKLAWVTSSQHAKIKGDASPYDGNHLYWAKRMEKYSGFSHRISKLIKQQYGRCAICHEPFTPMDVIEADHIVPRSKGGSDKYSNLQALHKHCHIQKSLRDSTVSSSFSVVGS